jgi:hypothetical protein
MDQASYEKKILRYAADKNWQVRDVLHKEYGCLPIAYHGVPKPKESRPALGLRVGSFTQQLAIPFMRPCWPPSF